MSSAAQSAASAESNSSTGSTVAGAGAGLVVARGRELTNLAYSTRVIGMSQYEINHRCGHTRTVNITGTNVRGERERRAANLAAGVCPDCYRAHQDATTAEQAAALGLPELTGTDRQVAWAMKLRAEVITLIDQRKTKSQAFYQDNPDKIAERDAVFGAIDAEVAAHTDAAWWIEHQGHSGYKAIWNAAIKAAQERLA